MSTNDAIDALIAAAKRLRDIADELGNVAVKAQILDVLVELQEFRTLGNSDLESRHEPGPNEPAPPEPAAKSTPVAAPATLLGEFTQEHARMESSGEIETYAFHLDEPEEAAEDTAKEASESKDAPEQAKSGNSKKAKAKAGSDEAAAQNDVTDSESELSDEEKFALAEQRIADLEPLHQAALKRMNDVLTPEQAARKATATKKGLAAGLKGKPLQESVLQVLHLSDEQEQQIAKGRHDLHQIRLAISKQVEGLLSKEQLDRLLRSHRH